MKVENVLRVQNIQKVRNDEFFWKICGEGFLRYPFDQNYIRPFLRVL